MKMEVGFVYCYIYVVNYVVFLFLYCMLVEVQFLVVLIRLLGVDDGQFGVYFQAQVLVFVLGDIFFVIGEQGQFGVFFKNVQFFFDEVIIVKGV